MSFLTILVLISTFSFLFFGFSCFFVERIRKEFIRYKLSQYLKLVGTLQVTGALGLVTGYFFNPVLSFFSAIGLSLLMLLGFGVRLRVKDSFLQSLPSFSYAVLNGYIAIAIYFTL
ncbi:DoxX-like family protein [Salegentibacter holothuriorum]|uniref:DoxX-like family protein n=1 Tax=Salegentibacter holothuriorum TaxID=241145 RepID=A0A1T5ABZ9_9FLAO|nr:DoxX family protein [Salegentibacter holothuriorum]SKB32213.1 DoxX-like family protein [Salegentibacter holothuriorum]